MQNIKAAR